MSLRRSARLDEFRRVWPQLLPWEQRMIVIAMREVRRVWSFEWGTLRIIGA